MALADQARDHQSAVAATPVDEGPKHEPWQVQASHTRQAHKLIAQFKSVFPDASIEPFFFYNGSIIIVADGIPIELTWRSNVISNKVIGSVRVARGILIKDDEDDEDDEGKWYFGFSPSINGLKKECLLELIDPDCPDGYTLAIEWLTEECQRVDL